MESAVTEAPPPSTGQPDPYWSTAKIAAYFDVEPSTVLRWIHDGELTGKKLNNKWKVRQSEVYRYRDEKFGD